MMESREPIEIIRELRRERKLLQNIMATIPDALLVLDKHLRIKSANLSFYELFQTDAKKTIGSKLADVLEDRDGKLSGRLAELFGTDDLVENYELRYQSEKLGERIFNITAIGVIVEEEEEQLLVVMQDITGRRKAEEQIKHLNLVLRAIRNVNQLITREKDRDKLIQGVCDILIETRGYYNAWIALLDESGKLVAYAESGVGKDFLAIIEKLKRGELTACAQKALGQSDIVLTENPLLTCADCPLAKAYGGRGGATVRLEAGEKIYGILSASISIDYIADKEERTLFKEVSGDIGMALQNIELGEQRKQAEEAIKLAYAELDQIFDATADAIRVVDKDFNILRVNEAFATLLGISKDEAAGKKCYDVLRSPRCHSPSCPLTQILNGEERIEVEEERERGDGTRISCIVTVTPFRQPDGKVIGIVSTIKDITERKRAEEALQQSERKYRSLFEEANDAIFLADIETGCIVDANKQAERLLGRSAREIIGIHQSQLHPPDKVDYYRDKFRKHIETGHGGDFEAEVIRKDGTMVPVYISASVIQLDERKLIQGIFRDITERKRAEEALKSSRDYLKKLTDSMWDAVFSVKMPERIIEWANDSFRLIGYEPEECIGRTTEFLYPDKKGYLAFGDKLKRTIAAGKDVQHTEQLLKRKNGEVFPAEITTTFFREKGELVKVTNIIRDITERKRAEEALADEAVRRRILVEQSRDGIVILDENGKVFEANQRFSQMLGYSPEEILKLHVWDWDTQWAKEQLLEMITSVNAAGDHFETYHRRKDGTIYDVEISTNGAIIAGQKLVFCVCRDITERKRAEEALQKSEQNFRNSLDNSPLGIRIIAAKGELLYANQAILDMYDYSSFEELKNTPTKQRYTPESYVEHRKRVKNRKLGMPVPDNYEIDIVRKDGEVRHLQVLRREIVWNGEKQFQALYQDITERKKIEEEERKLERLESIGSLAGGIAHDFNNLLTGIMGNISLAKRYIEPKGKAEERLIEAERASLRARDLTQQLLTFAKGGAPIKKTVSTAKLLEEAATFALRGSNVKCEFSLPDDLWPVEVDEGQMNQVITNLVINADEAMPEGGILEIKAENTVIKGKGVLPLAKGNYIKITIKDHGIGIPKEHLDRIFDPFFTTKKRGSGLGLTTTYSIITNHNGYITVESELGVGTTFYIYLPASKKLIPTKKAEEAIQAAFLGKRRILVMDDEEMIREMLSNSLSTVGYEVELTSDGVEAIEQYAKAKESGQPFDAVILDLTVPGGMGGEKAIKKLLEIDPNVIAIASSGYSTDPIMSKFEKYGFSVVVTKPYSAGELERTLQRLIIRNRRKTQR